MKISALLFDALTYNAGDAKRIQHLIKVHSFAKLIGTGEGLSPETLELLEAEAILHDIGIHNSEKKYGSASGCYQEIEGPPVAREILEKYALPKEKLERICHVIGHHHTYRDIDGADYQILVEADFLVNIFEDAMKPEQIKSVREKIFKTSTGRRLLSLLYSM